MRLNKIRDHALVVSHLRLTSDTRTRCCDVEHHSSSTFQNMFQNEREGNSPCRCQDVWSRSTSTRSFSLIFTREAKVCRIELTYNPIRLVYDHAIDRCPLSSRNAFTLFYSRHLFFNRPIRVPRWETTANKLGTLSF